MIEWWVWTCGGSCVCRVGEHHRSVGIVLKGDTIVSDVPRFCEGVDLCFEICGRRWDDDITFIGLEHMLVLRGYTALMVLEWLG